MIYDVDFFIKKFEAIPEEKWCRGDRQNDKGQRCAHGHCYPEDADELQLSGFGFKNEDENSLIKLAKEAGYSGFAPINNGEDQRYQQDTPKQRMLAVLNDIKNGTVPKPIY